MNTMTDGILHNPTLKFIYSIKHCNIKQTWKQTIEWLRERTEHLDTFLFFRPSLSGVLFPMFCLLVEGECQILVF